MRWKPLLAAALLAGCRTPLSPAPPDPAPLAWTQAESDLAEALACFGLGILREGTGDPGAADSYERAAQLCPDNLDLLLRVAAFQIRHDQIPAAVALLEDAVQRRPDAAEARLFLGQVYQAQGNLEAANQAYRAAVRLDPANHQGACQLALLLRVRGDQAAAIAVLEEALPAVADRRPVLRLLGDLHLQRAGDVSSGALTPDLQQAIASYEQAAREPADNLSLSYLQRLGDLFLLTRQFNAAIACLEEVQRQEPDDLSTRKKLALSYLAAGDALRALPHLQAVAEREPDNRELQAYLGELSENITEAVSFLAIARELTACAPEEFAGKLAHWQETLSRHPGRVPGAQLLVQYGIIARRRQMPDRAEAFFRKALEMDPVGFGAGLQLAALFLSQERNAEAVAIMEQIAATQPDEFQVLYVLGLAYGRQERYAAARATLEQALDLAWSNPAAAGDLLNSGFYFHFGSVCERLGQFADAALLLEHAIALDPANSEARNYLAYMWAGLGVNLDRALEHAQLALEEEPKNGAYLDTLGWIYFQQGRLPEALDEIRNAQVFLPEEPEILEHLGDVLMALGHAEEARHWWRESLRRNPGNTALAARLKAHAAEAGNPPPPAAE